MKLFLVAVVVVGTLATPQLKFEDDAGECTFNKTGALINSDCDFSVGGRNILSEFDAFKTQTNNRLDALEATPAPTKNPTKAPTNTPR